MGILSEMRLNICTLILIVSVLIGVAAFPLSAFGQCAEHDYYWVASFGDWSIPENWQHEEKNPDPCGPPCVLVPGVPGSQDWVNIINGGTANISSNANAHHLEVESSGLQVLGGSLMVVSGALANGGGWFTQVAGTAIFSQVNLGSYSGSSGTYNLQDGDLYTNGLTIGFSGGSGNFVQSGGTHVAKGIGLAVSSANSEGNYQLSDGSVSAGEVFLGWQGSGSFTHTGGTATITGLWIGGGDNAHGTYSLSGNADLTTHSEVVGLGGTGVFTQEGGTHTATCDLAIGGNADCYGSGEYILRDGELSSKGAEYIGHWANGTFTHTGGTNTSGNITVGNHSGSSGRYELSNNAQVIADSESIGFLGTGTFIQSGGMNTTYGLFIGNQAGSDGRYIHTGGTVMNNQGDSELYLGTDPNSVGRYELSGSGGLFTRVACVGYQGTGTFTQTGGTHRSGAITVANYPDSSGTYELSGDGRVIAGDEFVGYLGTGTFIHSGGTNAIARSLIIGCEPGSSGTYEINGGRIEGTTSEAGIVVRGGRGALTGPGTFDIMVTYESEKIYGTYANQSVDVTFEPMCLKVGGEYDVEQFTPADFAGGMVSNLLESSVFDVSFDGSFCGEFGIAIPYDEAEVAALDANEMNLVVLHETDPETYEQLPILKIDTESDVIYALSNSLGKYAVLAPEAVTVIVHGYRPPPGTVPQWAYDMRQAILDRTEETYPGMVVIVFDWAEASNDNMDPVNSLLGHNAAVTLKLEARHLANQLINTHLVTADPGCHVHLIGHSRGGSLVSYAASLLNSDFGRRVVNHMTILDGIDEKSQIAGWYLQDPAICGNNADWTDNYYQTSGFLQGQSRPEANLNEEWLAEHGGFAEAYTDTIIDTESDYGYYWSLGGGGWDDPAKCHGRTFCSQSGTEIVINGDYETQDFLGWSTLLGTPLVVLHGADNYVCQMEEQSSVAIAQNIMTPAHARFLLFDFAFTDQGDGDSLTVTLGGTTIFSFVGTDFESTDLVSSGLIGISAFAGQTSCELVFMLNSVGEPGATVLLDNIKVITAGDPDADGDVDMSDFSIFAAHWLYDSCNAPDWCHGSDIAPEIPDGVVDILDLGVLADHWLECSAPECD